MLSSRALASCLPFVLLACSGGDFQLGGPNVTTDGGAADEGASDVASDVSTDAPAAEDTRSIGGDAGGTTDSGPPCDTTPPALACTTPYGEYAPQFSFGGNAWLAPRLDAKTRHAISYVTARAGRHEKLILRLRRIHVGDGAVGRLTLTAYRTPCPGVHVPLGASRSLTIDEATVERDYSFYFTDSGNTLPAFPAGTRLTFVLSTDSGRYAFELGGQTAPSSPPPSLQWAVQGEAETWTTPSSALPGGSAWLRGC